MEDKKGYTKRVESLLFADPRSEVDSCNYTGGHPEVVEIRFIGGYTVKINVTHNSLWAILNEITREVYGDGAHGAFYRGFPEVEAEE